MDATIRNRKEATAWQNRYDPGAPKRGEPAPDFALSDTSGEGPVRLSELLTDRPVALVFGSFT